MSSIQSTLSTALQLGPVELHVRNLAKQKDFYHLSMGLEIMNEKDESIVLGIGTQPLLILHKVEYPFQIEQKRVSITLRYSFLLDSLFPKYFIAY